MNWGELLQRFVKCRALAIIFSNPESIPDLRKVEVAMYITRALEPLVRRYSEHFKVVVVTGPRQVGKTTMLKHLMEEDASEGIERAY